MVKADSKASFGTELSPVLTSRMIYEGWFGDLTIPVVQM
jgi:hypothetical protein